MPNKEMLINVSEGEECRIALVEDGRLDELYMERASSTSHVGNVYKGRVTNVEPSIQAAFIDFGLGRNGFLHISDLMPYYFGRAGEDIKETVGRKMARRDRPPIQRCLRRGDEIIVQIIKEGIGTKGPTLTTYVSIPGRILVMMPGMSKLGVSRKIEDEEERRRLRKILDEQKPPKDCGFIIRTAGVGKSKTEISKDLTYLTRLWQVIQKKLDSGPGPMELYTEGDLVTRTVRDVFTPDIERIIIDHPGVARRVQDFIKIAMPRTKNKVEYYEGAVPLLHQYGIEREIEQMYSRHVPLPSGGSLVIDSTEAVVAIDVNSGKFRDHADAETTAFKTDMEAADEIARQLRLRDLGGVIICDFIDLRYERHRRELEKHLHDLLGNDRAKTKMLRMSEFGIIEMTRQRMRPSLKRSVYFDCPHCKGSGLVKTPESMGLDVMRKLAIAVNDERVNRIELGVCPEVAFYLQNRKRAAIASLEGHWKKRIVIQNVATLGLDDMKLDLFDLRDGLVFLEELGMVPQGQLPQGRGGHQQPHQHQRGGQQQRGGRPQDQQRRDDRGGRSGGREREEEWRDEEGDEERPEQRGGRDEKVEEQEDGADEPRGPRRDDRPQGQPRRDQGRDQGRPQGRDPRQDNRQGQRPDQRPNQRQPQQGREQGREQGQPRDPRRDDRGRDQGRHQDQRRDQQGRDQQGRDPQRRDGGRDQGQDQRRDPGQGQGQGGRDARGRGGRDVRGRDFRGRDMRGRGPEPRQDQPFEEEPLEETPMMDESAARDEMSDAPVGARAEAMDDIDRVEDAVEQREEALFEESDEIAPPPAPMETIDDVSIPSPSLQGRGGTVEVLDDDDEADLPTEDRVPATADEEREVVTGDVETPVEEPAEAPAAEEPAPAKKRGSRGGSGTGGRGRGKKAAKTTEVAEAPDAKAPEKAAEVGDATEAPKKKTRRGTRGGRGRSKKGAAADAVSSEPEGDARGSEGGAEASARSKPAPVPRTGSTDRHMFSVNDEPVLPPPASRPRTYRDLDHIPDDFD